MFRYCCCHHPKLLQFTALGRRGETFSNVLIIWNLTMTCVNDNHTLGRFHDQKHGSHADFFNVCVLTFRNHASYIQGPA
jgi:hypothetical protein